MRFLYVDCTKYTNGNDVFLVDDSAREIKKIGSVGSVDELSGLISEHGVEAVKIKQGQQFAKELRKRSMKNYTTGVKVEDVQ